MTMPDEPDLAAGEFALGVLEGDERAAASRRLLADPAFAREVERWRAHFAALYAQWPASEPGEHAARRIELIARPGKADARWQWLAAITSVAAAVLLLIVVGDRRAAVPTPSPTLIAVITPTHGEPFGATLVSATRAVTLGGGVPVPANRAAELWAIGADGVPRAAGLVASGARHLVLPAGVPLIPGTTLAISIEPIGGSPKPTPTGPVVATGRLVTI